MQRFIILLLEGNSKVFGGGRCLRTFVRRGVTVTNLEGAGAIFPAAPAHPEASSALTETLTGMR